MVHLKFVQKQLLNTIQIILGTICIFYLISILESYICGLIRKTVENNKIDAVVQPTSMQIFQVYLGKSGTTVAQNIIANAEPESELRGHLNVHHWYSICGETVDSLRRHALFPKYPKLRDTITHLRMKIQLPNFGQRIFGYIHPPLGGSYTFSVSSRHLSEVWLSSDERPNNAKLICQVPGFTKRYNNFNKYKNQMSQKISLDGGKKYFFEVLHKQGKTNGHLHVMWKPPGWKKLTFITSKFMSLFIKDKLNISVYKRDDYEPLPKMILEYHVRTKYPHPIPYRDYTRLQAGSDIELLRHSHMSLPICKKFVISKNITRYEGRNFTHSPSVFPKDGSSLALKTCSIKRTARNYKHHCEGNPVLKKEEAYVMAEKYLNVSFPG